MFRHLRKTRQYLLKNGKLLKYFTYATGEILLVIIGILAALQINNWSEEQKNTKKTEQILKQIQSDLRANIIETTDATSFYFFKDSIMQIILRDEIDYFDFDNFSIGSARSFTTTRLPLTFLDNGFQNWADQENIPVKFQELNENFNRLFVDLQSKLNYNEEKMGSIVDGNVKYFSENFTWLHSRIGQNMTEEQRKKEASYYQYDSLYKNRVILYGIYAIKNHLPLIDNYRITSIDTYNKINELLGADATSESQASFLLSESQLNKMTGTYQFTDDPDIRPVITTENNSIIYTLENSSISLTPLSPHVFFTSELGDPAMIYFQLDGNDIIGMYISHYGVMRQLKKIQ